MKAFYPQLSYTFFIVISIIALAIILITVNLFTESIQRNYAYGQLNYIVENVKSDILRLYSSNAEGRFELSAPKEIIGNQYTIEMSQNNLKLILNFKDKKIEVERLVNISATLSGKSYAPASIEMNKTDGNTLIRLV